MKAAVVYETKEPIDVVEFTSGSVGPHDVRVRVGAAGCATPMSRFRPGTCRFRFP